MKRLLFLVISAAMAGLSLHLMDLLNEYATQLPTPIKWLLGVILTLLITGIVAYPGFVLPLWKALPDAYYRVRSRRRIELLARLMGMGLFHRILMAFFWGQDRHRAKFFDGTRHGLRALDVETRRAEFGHLLAGVLVMLATGWLALQGVREPVVAALTGNVLLNLYPIVLQRTHRARLSPLLRRLDSA